MALKKRVKMNEMQWFRRLVVGVGLCVMACGVVGCSSNREFDDNDDFLVTWEHVLLNLEDATESEQRFLADGVVTPAERERAFLNFVECAAQGGVRVSDWELYPHGGSSYHTELINGGSRQDEPTDGWIDLGDGAWQEPETLESTVHFRCFDEHFEAVEALYTYKNQLKGEALEQIKAATAQCMRDQGLNVPEGASRKQMRDIDPSWNALCWTNSGGPP